MMMMMMMNWFIVKWISLCLISEILGQQIEEKSLTMSSGVFDDQYETCVDKMESKILEGLLVKEKNKNSDLDKAWNEAAKKWESKKGQVSVPRGFRDEYGIALMVYSNNKSNVYSNFNNAVRNYQNTTSDNFPYHSLHFFLTRAVQVLRSSCWWKPWSVYRGMKGVHFQHEQNIRFGQFSSSSTDKQVALGFGNHSFFTITSCFGVDIRRFSYFPEQKEVLIPVDEVFKVISLTKQGNSYQYVLETTKRRCHHYNCHNLIGGYNGDCVYSRGVKMSTSLVILSLLFGFPFFLLPLPVF
ncbi:hypothetical protein XELAEV_18016506mg [Xenopus laevis]|nr:hypothetical protein XELAEV_18016506mg [Xenopus laevis]